MTENRNFAILKLIFEIKILIKIIVPMDLKKCLCIVRAFYDQGLGVIVLY